MIVKTMMATLAAVFLAGGTALAGGGGKISWREGTKHDAALAEAKAKGVPLMLYFTGEG